MADEQGVGSRIGRGVVKALGEVADRMIPQGRDELANAIFNGSAYWPGTQPGQTHAEPDASTQATAIEAPDHGLNGVVMGPEPSAPGPQRPMIESPVIEGQAHPLSDLPSRGPRLENGKGYSR